jgi:NAD(P)-dependent dehydrogenase (short-subunit alcohol dehydrogenase family)
MEAGRGRRTALVTGAASGIGRALAGELAGRGVAVTLADRDAAGAEEAAAAIRAGGGEARARQLDVRDAARFREVVREIEDGARGLDYLFNNAGIGVGAETHDFVQADWDDVIDVNLRGVAHGILAAYPGMRARRSGHIVNTASMAGLVPGVFQISYAATKYAVVGLSRSLRIEARAHGVRVTVLCPGVIRTPILTGGRFGRLKFGVPTERAQASLERLRPMDPQRFARAALRGVDRNRAVVIAPAWWRIAWWLERWSPWLSERLAGLGAAGLRREMERARAGP